VLDDLPDDITLPVDTLADRWGSGVDAGFIAVPNMLIKGQARLGLTSTDVVVLLNIMMHWWYRDRRPSPRSSAIAKRSGLGPRTVQRSLRKLERLGLLLRIRVSKDRTEYSLEGLRKRLEYYAERDVWYRSDLGSRVNQEAGNPC
jgi:DNA-binding MarR family transcriptional regulator